MIKKEPPHLDNMDAVLKQMREDREKERANPPPLNISSELADLVDCNVNEAFCPFCNTKMYYEFATMLTCKECPQGFWITDFEEHDDKKLDVSKFTITFDKVAVRILQLHSLGVSALLLRREDDPEKLVKLKGADFRNNEDNITLSTIIKFDYKNVESMIEKLKTYITFG